MINKNSVRIEKVQIETPSGEWIWTGTPERVMSHQAFARLTRGADIALGDRAKREEMSEGEVVRAELLAGERFFVTATKTAFRVTDAEGKDRTDDYLFHMAESEEMREIRHFEDYKKEIYPHKLLHYRTVVDEERDAFFEQTDGVGTMRCFRSYLSNFIRTFEPEVLLPGKPYLLVLNKQGEFCVENVNATGNEQEVHPTLSEQEMYIYHYLCYLHLSRFWSGVEQMRDQHHCDFPLVVDDFLDHLDASCDAECWIRRAEDGGRQAFFSSCSGANDGSKLTQQRLDISNGMVYNEYNNQIWRKQAWKNSILPHSRLA